MRLDADARAHEPRMKMNDIKEKCEGLTRGRDARERKRTEAKAGASQNIWKKPFVIFFIVYRIIVAVAVCVCVCSV